MPNTDAAKKALRQNKTRRKRNLNRKKRMREAIKKYEKLIENGKKKKAEEQLKQVYKVLDKLTKVNFIAKNKTKRLKSRLAKKLNK